MMRRPFCLIAALFTATAAVSATPQSIPGPDGGWDYSTVDPAANRLYIARNASVTVVDLAGAAQARSIGTIAHGHAVVPLPGHRLLVTSGDDGTVRLLDTKDGHEISRLAVGRHPDGAIYDPATRRAYVMVSKDGKVAVIDTKTFRLIASIPLKPALEFPAIGPDDTLFVNDEDANEIETVDTHALKAGDPIALPGCERPTGLAYDPASGRLVSACANGQAAIVDAKARRMIALVPIGKGPDAVILDARHHRVFIPCGKSAELDMIRLDQPQPQQVSARIPTEMGSRSGALDPRTGMLYLPAADFGPAPAGGGKPTPIDGTFHILMIPGDTDTQ